MEHKIFIKARFRPEIFERILRVVRHRGFHICSMNVNEDTSDGSILMDLTVISERSIHLLSTQLAKLTDVDNVEVKQHATQLSQLSA